jgi:hypothetical protein
MPGVRGIGEERMRPERQVETCVDALRPIMCCGQLASHFFPAQL